MGNNMFETTSLVLVKNFPHKILKSSIPLSNSNSALQLELWETTLQWMFYAAKERKKIMG